MSGKISVVIPVFNGMPYLEEALQSVLNQDPKFHEIIIVNDGSTDGTKELLERSVLADKLSVIHQNNKGQGESRNIAIDACTGDFVYFCDADDLIVPRFTKIISNFIDENVEMDLILFSADSFYENGADSQWRPEYHRKIDGKYSAGSEAYLALSENDNLSAAPWIYVVRKALLDSFTIRFRHGMHEDEDFFAKICSVAGATVITNQALYKRRIHANSLMTATKGRIKLTGLLAAIREISKFLRTERLSELGREVCESHLYSLAGQYVSCAKKHGLRCNYVPIFFGFLLARLRPPLKLIIKSLFGFR